MVTLLIVDDNKKDRECIRDMIKWDELGIEVVGLAVNGQDGYNKALELKPNIILTDISMPVSDGIKMTEQLKDKLPETKYIFMSCFDKFEYVKTAIDLNITAYILKPIHLEELHKVISNVKNALVSEIEANKIKSQVEKSMPILQENFFRDLLYGRIYNKNQIYKQMEYLSLKAFNAYCVIIMKLNDYDTEQEIIYEQLHTLMEMLKKNVEDIIFKHYKGFVLFHDINCLSIILCFDVFDESEELNNIISLLNDCKAYINEGLNKCVTFGISDIGKDITLIHKLFSSAEYATKSKFYSKGNSLILAAEVKQVNVPIPYDLLEIRDEINSIFEIGEKKDVISFVEKYYNEDMSYSEIYVKSFCISIVNTIQTTMEENGINFEIVIGDEHTIWEKLLRFETIADIKQWIINIIEATRQFISSRNNNRHQKIIDNIRLIINEKYSTVNNINDIIGTLYISASNANLIFKRCTGKTIFEELIAKRMDVAKKLLADPYIKIYEVSNRVGYNSKNYFAFVFKEYFGMTPSEYRDKYTR